MGRLTTHVLDTARGRPAAGVLLELWRVNDAGARQPVVVGRTNDEGRTDAPLLEGIAFTAGGYELVFHIGPYFAETGTPPFLDLVPVRFGVSDPAAHYHVPLLVSPWAYSTYRGS